MFNNEFINTLNNRDILLPPRNRPPNLVLSMYVMYELTVLSGDML